MVGFVGVSLVGDGGGISLVGDVDGISLVGEDVKFDWIESDKFGKAKREVLALKLMFEALFERFLIFRAVLDVI